MRAHLILSLALLGGCPKPIDSDTETDTELAVLESIEVTPQTLNLAVGQTEQLVVTGHFSDDSEQDVTSATSFRVVNASVASVSSSGTVSALAAGTTDIEVDYQGFDDTIRLTVTTAGASGTVTFMGWPVMGVPVELTGAESDDTTTNNQGVWNFAGLANGNYTVRTDFAEAPRATEASESFQIDGGAVNNIELEVATGGFPAGGDEWEPDNFPGSATDLPPNVLQHHTLYLTSEPADGGDNDFLRMTGLIAGTTYEIFTAGLCATCDTRLSVTDTGGTNVLEENDDVDLGAGALASRILFTPEANGDYLIRVDAYEETRGVASYFIGWHVFADGDSDGHHFFDCNDADGNVNYFELDDPDTVRDDDCSGQNHPGDTFEPGNDTRAGAHAAMVSQGAFSPPALDLAAFHNNSSALGNGSDVDFWSITVPARRAYQAYTDSFMSVTYLNTDGITERTDLANTSGSPVTLYIRVEGTSPGPYVLWVDDLGADQDQDGSYSQDWEDRDCDDANSAVTDESNTCDGTL